MRITLICDKQSCRAEDANGKILAMVPLQPVARIVQNRLQGRVGWSPSTIRRRLSAMTKAVAKSHILKQVKAIASSPYVKKGLALGATIYPPLGISLAAVKAISNTVERAKRGDYDSQKTLAQLKLLADSGDPRAVASFEAARKIYELGITPSTVKSAVSGERILRQLSTMTDAVTYGPRKTFELGKSAYEKGRSLLRDFASYVPSPF